MNFITSGDLFKFRDLIGFMDNDKSRKLNDALSQYVKGPSKRKWSVPIVSIESTGIENVYDCTIPDGHAFSANGFDSHNCSEISLEPYELCNLSELFPTRCTGFDDFIRN